MDLDLTSDIAALCRVCMIVEADQFTSLHDKSSSGGHLQPTLYEMLEVVCAPVFTKSTVEDIIPDLPTKVCPPCRNAIVAAYNLHQQCIETDRRLGELLALKWELQGPGGEEDACKSTNLLTIMKEEPVEETLDANEEYQFDEPKEEIVLSEESNHGPVNKKRKTSSDSNLVTMMKEEPAEETSNGNEELNEELSHEPVNKKRKKTSATKSKADRKKSCPACDKVFASRETLVRHISENYCDLTNDPKKRTCDICKKIMKSVRMLEVHRQMHNSANIVQPTAASASEAGSLPTINPHNPSSTEMEEQAIVSSLIDAITFSCTYCDQKFYRKNEMQHHLNSHREFLTCSNCGITYTNRTALRSHLNRKICRIGRDEHRCEHCTAKFPTKLLLNKHIEEGVCKKLGTMSQEQVVQEKAQEAAKTYPCPICPITFVKNSRLQYHLISHKKIACPKCDKKFSAVSALRVHIRDKRCPMLKNVSHVSELVLSEHQCKDCNITFSSRRAFDAHIGEQRCRQQTAEKFPCKICGKIFDRRSRLMYHVSCHRRRVACSRCPQTFPTRTSMLMHIKHKKCPTMKPGSPHGDDTIGSLEDKNLPFDPLTAEGELANETGTDKQLDCELGMTIKVEEPVVEEPVTGEGKLENDLQEVEVDSKSCKICSETFKTSTELELHEKQQHKFFVCGRCEEAFQTALALDSHMRAKHMVVPVQCGRCKKWCNSQKELEIHQLEPSCIQATIFPCDLCEKTYDSAKKLHTHQHNHRSRVICNKCGMSIQTKGYLKDHLAYRCLGTKARTCEVCNLTLDTFALYRKHRREHHRGPIDCSKCGRTLAHLAAYRVHVRLKRCKNIAGKGSNVT